MIAFVACPLRVHVAIGYIIVLTLFIYLSKGFLRKDTGRYRHLSAIVGECEIVHECSGAPCGTSAWLDE